MPNQMGYLSLALYAASFLCYARILYAPNVWLGRLATAAADGRDVVFHYFALLERSPRNARGALRRSLRLDVAVCLASRASPISVWRFFTASVRSARLRNVADARLDGRVSSWLAPQASCPRRRLPAARCLRFHVTLNIWAYAAFALSFVLSLVYLVQDRVLRSRRPGAAFWRFPRSTCWIACRAAAFSSGWRLWRRRGERIRFGRGG